MQAEDEFNGKGLLADLSHDLDEIEQALQPLMSSASCAQIAADLPLLDKAKFHVLAAYSVESLIFSSLRLAGVDAKEHAVFSELARVKSYFGKIKAAEARPDRKAGADDDVAGRKATLHKDAAARLIRGNLSVNSRLDRLKAEKAGRVQPAARGKLTKLDESDGERPQTPEKAPPAAPKPTSVSTGKRKRAEDMWSGPESSVPASAGPSQAAADCTSSPSPPARKKKAKTSKPEPKTANPSKKEARPERSKKKSKTSKSKAS